MAHGDAVAIDAQDLHHEAMANLWCFSPTDEEAPGIRAEALAAFVQQIVAARRQQLHGGPAMLFYCWHDAQARQLRFSLVSACHGRLPFRCAVHPRASLDALARQIVDGDWNHPHWGAEGGAQDVIEDGAADAAPPPLPVFVADLP